MKNHLTPLLVLAACIVLIAGLVPLQSVSATGVVGTGTPASCTETAFNAALKGGGPISFNCGLNPIVITLTSEKSVKQDTTIDGNERITLSGGNKIRLFSIDKGVTFSLNRLTLAEGNADKGGVIDNQGGLVSLTDSMITNSKASEGGGAIYSQGGRLTLLRTTIYANKADKDGGALYIEKGVVTLANVTLSGNSAGENGGALYNAGGKIKLLNVTLYQNDAKKAGTTLLNDKSGGEIGLMNTIIAINPPSRSNADPILNCDGPAARFVDGGNNLQFPDRSCGDAINLAAPQLTALDHYGAYPMTHALRFGSPALNAANPSVCQDDPINKLDERKAPRLTNNACDIGAYEQLEINKPPTPTAAPPSNNPGQPPPPGQPTNPPPGRTPRPTPTPCPPGYQGDPAHGIPCIAIPK